MKQTTWWKLLLICFSLYFLFWKWWFIFFVLVCVIGLASASSNLNEYKTIRECEIKESKLQSRLLSSILIGVLLSCTAFVMGIYYVNLKPFILIFLFTVSYIVYCDSFRKDLSNKSINLIGKNIFPSDGVHDEYANNEYKTEGSNKDSLSAGQYHYTRKEIQDLIKETPKAETYHKPLSVKETFPIIRTTSYVRSVRTVEGYFNHDSIEKPGYLLENGYSDGDIIYMYENEDLDAKLEKNENKYKVFVKPKNTDIQWEEIGYVANDFRLQIVIANQNRMYVKVDGGSAVTLVEGTTRNRLLKKFVPFSFTLVIEYKETL